MRQKPDYEKYVPSANRIPEWDGFRVLLVFLVSWYHIWQQSWLTPKIGNVSLDFLVRTGYMQVDGTILLSGLLLFLPYARAMLANEAIPGRRTFYQRRIMRIVPSFYFVTLLLLFAVALPWGLYASVSAMAKDLWMHFTFTFTFRPETYIATPLGVASWTLAIEMQAYLIFPFLAKAVMGKPLPALLTMAGSSWLWRLFIMGTCSDYAMYVNQLPAFLDVYALGMGSALIYVKLTQCWERIKKPIIVETLVTAALIPITLGLIKILKAQEYLGDIVSKQAGQMIYRFPLVLLLAMVALALPFSLKPLRLLMGNRVMAFLSGLSMNYYLIHQNLAVHLKRLGIPASVHEMPNTVGEQPWQNRYTALCFLLSLLLAALITYLVEKPCAKLLAGVFRLHDNKRLDRQRTNVH